MEMFTKNRRLKIKQSLLLTLFLISLVALKCCALDTFQFFITSNKDLQAKLEFIDKLSTCEKHKYQQDGVGSYEILGKQNKACKVKWTLVDCNFPDGVYQEFSTVQRRKTLERYNNFLNGKTIEIEDKDYRYLYNTGNLYCQNIY